MLVIGLTGGIGSGKSTVAKFFSERNITVIDTDQIAREVTLPNNPALQQIVKEFGSDILQLDGNLNRAALRKIIFANEDKRRWLEKLLHPLIRAEVKRQIETATSPYCIVVVPLLLETEVNPLIDRILVIDTPETEQIKRTQTRDNISRDEVTAIINTQVTRAKRLTAAHDVIQNNGTINELVTQINRLHGFYLALAQKTLQNK